MQCHIAGYMSGQFCWGNVSYVITNQSAIEGGRGHVRAATSEVAEAKVDTIDANPQLDSNQSQQNDDPPRNDKYTRGKCMNNSRDLRLLSHLATSQKLTFVYHTAAE